ncbi:MAG: hypothetical protein N2314_07045 [Brevinematales bacterium]|nr:hypothetical protein [Brevinematales bacterium]
MSDNLFETPFSFWIWALFYDIVALLFFWLPKPLRHHMLLPLRQVLENAIILAYLTDGSDIGFFESFILGADRTKEMVDDVYKILQVHQRANLKERLCAPLPDKRLHEENQDILCGFVQDKKRHVVDILRNRGQIIPYLHKRLAVRRPVLHALLWFGYSILER